MSAAKVKSDSSAPTTKVLPPENIYRVGDFVYVESVPVQPYHIRRIEELTKTSNGQVEAKVACFSRRRDLSSTLVTLADRHSATAEEENEIKYGDALSTPQKAQALKHREVFLTRHTENINANTIRGKCAVHLYSEVELLSDYLNKDDLFYYLLVHDTTVKTLLADRGEISIGLDHQATVPDFPTNLVDSLPRLCETPVWNLDAGMTDGQILDFITVARATSLLARSVDETSFSRDSSITYLSSLAMRDAALARAHDVLFESGYQVGVAIQALLDHGRPTYQKDQLESFTPGETILFEDAIEKEGKDFVEIMNNHLPWKTVKDLVEYYYFWKTTDRYAVMKAKRKKQRSADGEAKVTQIFIPSSNTAINMTLAVSNVGNSVVCEGCITKESPLWYPWSPGNQIPSKHHLCKDCWIYWKKYAGIKKSPDSDGSSSSEGRFKCNYCSKRFYRADRLASHASTHKTFKCSISSCGKMFDSKANLARHRTIVHQIRPGKKNDLPFLMRPTSIGRSAQFVVARSTTGMRSVLRKPYMQLNLADIRSEVSKLPMPSSLTPVVKKAVPKILPVIEELRRKHHPEVGHAHVESSNVPPILNSPVPITPSWKPKNLKSPAPLKRQLEASNMSCSSPKRSSTDSTDSTYQSPTGPMGHS